MSSNDMKTTETPETFHPNEIYYNCKNVHLK